MAPKPDVSDQRKEEILNAAVKVFADRGFSGARMDDIVKESGLSKGLLYWYFKNKGALIAAITERLFAPEFRAIAEIPAKPGSVRDRLMALARDTAKEITAVSRILPITFEFYSLAFRNKSVKKVMRDFFEVYYGSIQQVISQGIERRELHKVDPRQAAMSVAAVIEGTLLLWVFDPNVVDLSSQLKSGMELVVRGMELRHPDKPKSLD